VPSLVLNVGEKIANSMHSVPTVQSWLSGAASTVSIDTTVAQYIIDGAQTKLAEAVKKNFEALQDHMHFFVEKYNYLVNGEAAGAIDAFLAEEHTFEEYCEYIEKFRNVASEISSLNSIENFDMIRLDCDDIKRGLSESARKHSETLLERLTNDHKKDNEDICSEFEVIKERCLTTPENSEEMMDMINFVKEARTAGLTALKERITNSFSRLNYLLDVHIFDPEEIDLNETVLTWPNQIEPIFEQNDDLVEASKKAGEAELLAKRERVMLELEKLSRRAQEFEECGEVDLMQQYVTDTRTVQKRLTDVQEQIVFINKEEVLFKWDLTQYPLVEAVSTTLEPYQKLYGSISKWQKAEKRWMDGEFMKLESEAIEAEVDEFWRETYKANKFFTQRKKKKAEEAKKYAPRRKKPGDEAAVEEKKDVIIQLCTAVMDDVKEFKENIPLISDIGAQ
jgi:dynein heavy chain